MRNMDFIYIQAEDMITTDRKDISLETIAKVVGNTRKTTNLVKKMRVGILEQEQDQLIIHITDVIDALHQGFPETLVQNIGSNDTIVRWKKQQEKSKTIWQIAKILLVCVVVFFGAAFTVMAFHNDIGIEDIFKRTYEIITGRESDGATILEFTYSIGLLWGIVYFFHRFGRKAATTDPTPIEVAMRTYEKEVNEAIVENDARKRSKE